MPGPTAPASLPPRGLPGLDPSWSRLVQANDREGRRRTWHVLDTAPLNPVGTLLCVHGNPTWSYLWRSVAATLGARWRVVAVDHLGMGYSERTGDFHRLADRVAELSAVTGALALDGPVVTVGHDWGGSISLGWALDHPDQLVGIVLTNTAVAQPDGAPLPTLIAAARTPGVLRTSTVRTPAFVRGTLRLAHPPLDADVRRAFAAPYAGPARRQAVGDFVDDIPLTPNDPSFEALASIQERLPELASVPTLLLWGPRDPVFSDRYLRDLEHRMPHAHVHRFPSAGHLVVEDAAVADAVAQFVDGLSPDAEARAAHDGRAGANAFDPEGPVEAPPREAPVRRPLWSELDRRSDDQAPAVVEGGDAARVVSWHQLSARVADLGAGLAARGVEPGDRVALLVPPGADLTAVLYACWRIGAVVVVADAGLGLTGLRRALTGAKVRHVVAVERGLVAARAMRLPGQYLSVGPVTPAGRALTRPVAHLTEVAKEGRGLTLPEPPAAEAQAAVLFTSGATGPAKGVVYRHRQLEAQRDAVTAMFSITSSDRLVAAFAPFALYGPALGITTAVPDMDVTAPGTLTAGALAESVSAVDASIVFASPAALRNVVDTAESLTDSQRKSLSSVRALLSAGAPVPPATLRAASQLLGGCEAHTPYGMTEALPVADITLAELDSVGAGLGVCVGHPLRGVDVTISALSATGTADGGLTMKADVTGEIVVRAAHVKDHYDQLWSTQESSEQRPGWHRTGDVGHLDADGRLWVEGRLAHIVVTAEGVVTPVGVEQQIEQLDEVGLAAVVGVGPVGCQQVVVVVEPTHGTSSGVLASSSLTDLVRERADAVDIAAVLVARKLPVDIRHNSKIDRTRVARWATRVLAGDRVGRL
ncbi:MAG: alpha/beta fold hydrolase [Actinomycetes bacterium]